MKTHRSCLVLTAALLLAGTAGAIAAPGDQPVPPLPAAQLKSDPARLRTNTLPAHGLFVGNELSEAAKAQLASLVVQAQDLDVEVALVVPTGPWKIDDHGTNERDLTPARLAAVRRFLTERGVDPKHIFVESRIDAKLKEPQLVLQMVGQQKQD